jgi:hypothetical protein
MASAEEGDGGLLRLTAPYVAKISSAIEGVTAIAIILNTEFVFWLVLGTQLRVSGIAVARVAAFGLLSLAIACWPKGRKLGRQTVQALFVYNLLAGYLPQRWLNYLTLEPRIPAPRGIHSRYSGMMDRACSGA